MRPEHTAPPEVFYGIDEAKKYSRNTRIMEIQATMSDRAIEMLCLPEDQPSFILDIGCGSGLSGECLTEQGHHWVGMDISEAMLDIAVSERETDGDVQLADMGQGVHYRAGVFDGAISISAVQWLCNADKKGHSPPKRLYQFFKTLYSTLRHGARAVLQLYPETPDQMELIMYQATRAGFSGGVVVDYPNSAKAKKYYLCLFAGIQQGQAQVPAGLSDEMETAQNTERMRTKDFRNAGGVKNGTRKQKVIARKERHLRKGKTINHSENTKYTGRKRRPKF